MMGMWLARSSNPREASVAQGNKPGGEISTRSEKRPGADLKGLGDLCNDLLCFE